MRTLFRSTIIVTILVLSSSIAAAIDASGPYDHLTCFKVEDSRQMTAAVDLDALQDEFDASLCRIMRRGRARLFCVPSHKVLRRFEDAEGRPQTAREIDTPVLAPDRVCYKIRCRRPPLLAPTEVVDQFGRRRLREFEAKLVCTPAVKSTVTTSTTLPPGDCRINDDCQAADYCARDQGMCEGPGTCSPRPTVCPDIFDPVCGCDGRTYGNACEAAAAGANVAFKGECDPPPCASNGECPEAAYCSKETCEGTGVCRPRPQACPDVYDPVCGCDGRTYGNACEAAAAAQNIAHRGECEPPACTTNEDCRLVEYCARESCEGAGTCRSRPEVCPDVFDPVCGCDGVTYGNACEAAAAGINVAFRGQCEPAICESNSDCERGLYCAKEGCEPPGSCRIRPVACPQVVDPVCGCNGVTYSNACLAASSAVNVAHRGPCKEPACTSSVDCPPEHYCAKADCGGEGACRERPGECPLLYDPVCGCDGVTYGNACEAAAAGISVASHGECR